MEKYLSVKEVAEREQVSESWVRRRLRNGMIGSFKVQAGKRVRYRISESDIRRYEQGWDERYEWFVPTGTGTVRLTQCQILSFPKL